MAFNKKNGENMNNGEQIIHYVYDENLVYFLKILQEYPQIRRSEVRRLAGRDKFKNILIKLARLELTLTIHEIRNSKLSDYKNSEEIKLARVIIQNGTEFFLLGDIEIVEVTDSMAAIRINKKGMSGVTH